MAALSIAPLLIHLVIVIMTSLFSHVQPICDSNESTALLQFKDSFTILRSASSIIPLAYPKVASWSSKKRHNCCSWDGVECDKNNTHVIALHLSASCLYGSINSSSSLFRLSHLRFLDLSYNDFKGSQIPSQLGYLRHLTYLNLSFSHFAGQIPLEISQLSGLSSLDLSYNFNLELKEPNFSTLFRNFNNIKHLDLSYVDISSSIPGLFANLSTLISLRLRACRLFGKFPSGIFELPNLQFLNLYQNQNLTGSLPEFHSGNPLRKLWLGKTGFFGHIPSSIGNLHSLSELDLEYCAFYGRLPSSLGNLSELNTLFLGWNEFSGTVDFNMFLNMKSLTQLVLSRNNLSVLITESRTTAGNINATDSKLEVLYLDSCNLTSFPHFLRYQDRLKLLDLGYNHIHGKVPRWIWNTSIESIFLASNILTGFIDVLPSRSLRVLEISWNRFAGPLPIPPPSIALFDVSYNEFSGDISPLFFNVSSLEYVDLSLNKLSGVLPRMCPFGSQLQVMDLSYNQFQGRLPPSLLVNCTELKVLKLENNHFNDAFPSWLGTLSKLKVLQLRSNQFHGAIERGSSADYDFPNLQIIDLSHNNFSGSLPFDLFKKSTAMKAFNASNSSYLGTTMNFTIPTEAEGWIYYWPYPYSVTLTNKGNDMQYQYIQQVFTFVDLSSNKFQGDIPEGIGDLQGLQYLNLSNNMLTGSIPSSMSYMTQLESLDLSRNKLSGKIPQQLVQLTFLAYFNVSFNHLSGPIPHGNQFSTFDNSAYEGNMGLWGYPSRSVNFPRMPPLALDSDDEDDEDSRSWFELNWYTILPGFVGGLLFGVAMEQLLAMDKCERFIKAVDFVVVTKTKWKRGWKMQH